MYHGLILLSVMIFGGCFALDDLYQQHRGSGIRISVEYALTSALAGLLVLTVINGFRLECTAFTLTMAMLSVLLNFGYTFCTFKALGTINLSLYSVFSMLGGMALPFLQGILIYGESLTLGKIICVLLICAALALTIQRGRSGRNYIYYAGVFLLNGASGMLSKVYTASQLPKGGVGGSEDFAYISHKVPSVMVALSAGQSDKGYPYPLHHPKTAFDEGVLWQGSAIYACIAISWLKNKG